MKTTVKADQPLRWRHVFEVEPVRPMREGDFPLDMLRYDSCHPFEEVDANAARACDGRTVRLVHFDADRDWHPNYRRWESFYWPVAGGAR